MSRIKKSRLHVWHHLNLKPETKGFLDSLVALSPEKVYQINVGFNPDNCKLTLTGHPFYGDPKTLEFSSESDLIKYIMDFVARKKQERKNALNLEREASILAEALDHHISKIYHSDCSLADSAIFNRLARLSRLSDKAHRRANRRFAFAFGGAEGKK